MRALFAALALLLAGCGGDPPSLSAWFTSGPVDKTTVSVTAWRGAVRLSNSTNGRIEFSIRGAVPAFDPKRSWILTSDERHRVALLVPESAKDAELEIEVAAPPGVSVSCACADARVEVVGAWGRLEVKTSGAITARVDRADSGELESQGGSVVYAAATGPTGDFAARSVRGDVAVRLPATWNGQIDCGTEGGKLDVPPHARLLTLWDEDKRHVVGHVGSLPKGKQPVARTQPADMGGEPEPVDSPPAVWGSSAQGDVSLRLGE